MSKNPKFERAVEKAVERLNKLGGKSLRAETRIKILDQFEDLLGESTAALNVLFSSNIQNIPKKNRQNKYDTAARGIVWECVELIERNFKASDFR